MSPRAEVDAGRCEAMGFCVQVAPTVFALEGARPPARVVATDLSDEQLEHVAEAEDMCPAQAILLRS
ncbi:ferredoxin [Nocardioides sediminis]|uniref:ferredoxin n=1 Tax=Nocardioides sediminis TaxID=433648 RepID=UPI000D31721B|nr:ferredoxin [Nocardioides sediminis]